MALPQKDQPLAGAFTSILVVLVIILLEEMFGLLPEHVFAGFGTPYGYMLALPVAFLFGSVFARAPDDLERGIIYFTPGRWPSSYWQVPVPCFWSCRPQRPKRSCFASSWSA